MWCLNKCKQKKHSGSVITRKKHTKIVRPGNLCLNWETIEKFGRFDRYALSKCLLHKTEKKWTLLLVVHRLFALSLFTTFFFYRLYIYNISHCVRQKRVFHCHCPCTCWSIKISYLHSSWTRPFIQPLQFASANANINAEANY